jgi:hypothetical protein
MCKTALLLLCALSLGTGSAQALRCGNALVSEGDHKLEVHKKCGKPIYVEKWLDQNSTRTRSKRGLRDKVYKSVEIESWTYNFGPHRFMQLLRFENGILKEIRDLERGF